MIGQCVVTILGFLQVGYRETGRMQIERALPLGTTVTAVGELARVSEAVGAYPGAVQHGGQVGP